MHLASAKAVGSTFRETCLACGKPMGPALTFAASLRCHDCRARRAPLRCDLVEHARAVDTSGVVVELPAHPDYGSSVAA
jgi:hypothetical protein